MAEFNFDELKKTITDAAEVVTKKTGDFVSVQKLRGHIYTLERSIDKKYQELGAIVFEQYGKGEEIGDESAIVCEEISQVNANISELREELASKHGCTICPVCEVEVPAEAMFCMKCGAPVPEECEATPSNDECDCGCGCGCKEEGAKDTSEADTENTAEDAKDDFTETAKDSAEVSEPNSNDEQSSESNHNGGQSEE